jgi:prepilin-type N-terminal cleavage/methylation domain-containing protein
MRITIRARRASAFTLIELLIVMAILAILAGILLPVIASAKLAAVRTVSLSNVKQIGTACLMYAGDNDDALPIYASGDVANLGDQDHPADTWVWQTQPYLKSLHPLIDPIMGDPHAIYSGKAWSSRVEQNLYPDYGLNYVFLAPLFRDPASGTCRNVGSVNASGASRPSSTIYFTTTYTPNEDSYMMPSGGYSDYGSWSVTAPGALSLFGESSQECVLPGMDWSKHPAGFNEGRPFTAEASQRYSGGSVVTMLDGHAKYLTADQQAAGTDWATSQYMHTRIVSPEAYLWSYDDSIFGANGL